MTKTTIATLKDRAEAMETWHEIDASQYRLGRMAVAIAEILMGKNKPLYTPHMQIGDGVIVINARDVQLSGKNKADRRSYRFYSGWPGGLKEVSLRKMLDDKPEDLINLVVRRMLPKNRLGRHMLRRLKVYTGSKHPHTAQKPNILKLDL